MKKNLKKAISAVIALAVAGSMIPASLAAKITLTDVADTASYATAVNTLVALGIIAGYEDGTFLPDNLITRAEVTKVVVAALNQTEAAENMKGSTNFSDVAADFWGSGYINAGVQNGFINGRDDGTFDPQANVSYAEIVKMLVATMGYEQYADYMGGYPNGYIAIANSEGITSGVNAKADDKVTRAQVAQLVYNALNTPIVQESGFVQTDTGIRPNIVKMDGTEEKSYKTLLTQYFDAYYLEGYVSETAKSSGGLLEFDEVEFAVAKAEQYDLADFDYDSDFTTKTNMADAAEDVVWTVNVGDTDAVDYEGVYASAIIMIDEYDDYHMISFMPSGKNKSVSFDADLIDTSEYEAEDADGNVVITVPSDIDRLAYFSSDTATKASEYKLEFKPNSTDLNLTIYVNGVKVIDPSKSNQSQTIKALQTYVATNNVGKVELVDTFKTDNKYDTIYVSYYETATVDSVAASTGRISFKDSYLTASHILLDEEDEKLNFHIYYNGEEITLAELKEDDVLSIAFNVGTIGTNLKTALLNSNFYDIYVSRNVQTGKLTGRNESDEVVTVGGTVYSFVGAYPTVKEMPLSDEYTLYVDNFGRIFSYEVNASSAKYAILDNFRMSTSDDGYKATLFTADGTSKAYIFSDSSNSKVLVDGLEVSNKVNTVLNTVYNDGDYEKGKTHITDRVIKYKVSSSTGELTYIEFLKSDVSSAKDDSITDINQIADYEEYKSKNGSIGRVKLSDATKVIDAIEYIDNGNKTVDLAVASASVFNDGTPYLVYAYGDKYNDGTYPFVVVIAGDAGYNVNTRFAVVASTATQNENEVGDILFEIPVLFEGKETTISAVEEIQTEVESLVKGDVIFFQLDSNSYVDQIDVVFNFDGGIPRYNALVAQSIIADNNTYDHDNDNNTKTIYKGFNGTLVNYPSDISGDFTKDWTVNSADAIQLVYGPVVAKTNSYMSVAKIGSKDVTKTETSENEEGEIVETTTTEKWIYTDLAGGVNDAAGCYDVDISTNTGVYVYDYAISNKDLQLSAGTVSGIIASKFTKSNLEDNGDTVVWNKKVVTDDDGNTTISYPESIPAGLTQENINANYPNLATVNFAFALVVDGEAVDVLVFNAK